MKPFSLAIHIFRRDLRLDDNTALIAALAQSEKVIPIFIFDDRQINHEYSGSNSFEFMLNSLKELDLELKKKGSQLFFFKGLPHIILDELISTLKIDAVFFNRDYTPFSNERDLSITELCNKHKVEVSVYADALLAEPEQVLKSDNSPYSIFTPFMKKAKLNSVQIPIMNKHENYYHGTIESNFSSSLSNFEITCNPKLLLKGGRKEGIILLKKIDEFNDYDSQRNLPSIKGTTLLAAHHKFGTLSIRETYHEISNAFNKEHTLINQLYWRDFFTHIVFHFPFVLGREFRAKYTKIPWENNSENFEKWSEGQTGFPIVDAGMRELVATGFMHNRVRMIVASFLTKDLHIDWRWGEHFFAQHLIDYDPSVNNGNWQWAASTGCDAQPYFRIFNPWSQQQKFDSECIYIKKWIPELNHLTSKEIHNLYKTMPTELNYPRPIVDHSEEAVKSKKLFA